MPIELTVNGSKDEQAGYITWTPVPLTIVDNSGSTNRVIKLTSASAPASVTKLWFLASLADAPSEALEIPIVGRKRTVFVAGMFQPGKPHFGASREGKDVSIIATFVDDPSVSETLNVMVRVRRNANELSLNARNAFLDALAKLNGIKVDDDPTPGPGKGIYVTDFVAMHVAGASDTQHGDSHFLPWHRLYLLDLERLLQKENPAVTLPYWRFDQAAPYLFHDEFMGSMMQIPRDTRDPGGDFDPGGATAPLSTFATTNPLSKWQIQNRQGIPRSARFNPSIEPANGFVTVDPNTGNIIDFALRSQVQTLGLADGSPGNPDDLGSPGSNAIPGFARMEGSPHGAAHVSFNGYINDVPVAPQDPLFFLLHCNVDRLWALWQAMFARDEPGDVSTYPYQSALGTPDVWKLVNADQWPWDDGLSQPDGLRPPGTRRQNFTDGIVKGKRPGDVPKIRDALDPYANWNPDHNLGFAYDDVPYRHRRA